MPTVEEVMTRGVISVKETDTIEEAMRLMVERHVSSLIVQKKNDGDVYGIITRKDIINHIIASKEDDLKKTAVYELMTKPVMTITKQMDVVAAAKLMEKTDVRRFPVCDGDKLVGIISNSDIFRAYVIDNIIEKQHKKGK